MKSQSKLVQSIKGKIATLIKLVSMGIKKYILKLIELEEKLEQEVKKQMSEVIVEKEPKYIELVTYRRKGINAYMVKEGYDYTHNMYGQPTTEEDKQRSYQGKRHTVEIRIDNLSDGKYNYKEAGGADFCKSVYGWLMIKNGEIVDQS